MYEEMFNTQKKNILFICYSQVENINYGFSIIKYPILVLHDLYHRHAGEVQTEQMTDSSLAQAPQLSGFCTFLC
jgi:hypothetical protein